MNNIGNIDLHHYFYYKDFSNYFFVFCGLKSGIFPEYELDYICGDKVVANHQNLIEKISEALDKKLLKSNSDFLHVWVDLYRYENSKLDFDDFLSQIQQKVLEFKNKQSENSGLS